MLKNVTGPGRELLARALQLPPAERARLAKELLDSVDVADFSDATPAEEEELSPAWRKEIERRGERLASGAAGPGTPADEALARIRRELEARRRRDQTAPD